VWANIIVNTPQVIKEHLKTYIRKCIEFIALGSEEITAIIIKSLEEFCNKKYIVTSSENFIEYVASFLESKNCPVFAVISGKT